MPFAVGHLHIRSPTRVVVHWFASCVSSFRLKHHRDDCNLPICRSVEANLPAPESFQCKPVTQAGASIILIHGTKDRLVPFEGGEGSLIFGLLKNPKVLSSHATAQYFADLDAIVGRPVTTQSISTDGFGIERSIWSNGSGAEVELIAIDGAGHNFPQPYYRARRILGPSPRDPNAAEVIWAYFERQRPR